MVSLIGPFKDPFKGTPTPSPPSPVQADQPNALVPRLGCLFLGALCYEGVGGFEFRGLWGLGFKFRGLGFRGLGAYGFRGLGFRV